MADESNGMTSEELNAKLLEAIPGYEPPSSSPAPQSSVTVSAAPDVIGNVADPALAGVSGYALNKIMPSELPQVKGIENARLNANIASESAGRANAAVEAAKNLHINNLDELKLGFDASKASLADSSEALKLAREQANKLGALPEVIPEGLTHAGDKWNSKVVGDMGPGGKSVTEAAKNYRTQQSLTPSESSLFKTSRTGLIVPNAVDTNVDSFLNQAQKQAQADFLKAQESHKAAQVEHAKSQLALEKHAAKPFVPQNVTAPAERATEKSLQASQKLAELEKMSPGWVSKTGMAFAKPILGALGAGMSVLEAKDMIEQYQKGNYGQAALSGMGAASGALMAIPHPAAKAAGAVLAVPPIAYGLYNLTK